jgi:heme exporter protein D
MSATAASRHALTERPSALLVYRDDGPLARALGAGVAGTLGRLPAVVLAVPGVLVEMAAIALGGADTSRLVAGLVLAWLVLCLGASRGASHADRLSWAGPTLVRMGEYVALIWIATLDGTASEPAAFALLCALAFRHYDLVYRLRHQGTTPPAWVDALSLGWEGRVILAFALLIAGALPAGYFVWAAIVAVAFVAEATHSWLTHSRTLRTVDYEDEEDEGQ